MGKINTKRVVLGGLLAGLVINISEVILNVVVLADQNAAVVESLGMGDAAATGVLFASLWALAAGVVAVWLYAMGRPRLGAGAKTAIVVGVAVWFLAYGFAATQQVGLFPTGMLWTLFIWRLFEVPLATAAGAWVYKEEA